MLSLRIEAITFDVFGTLLEYDPGAAWVDRYVQAVQAVREGRKPYRPLSAIFAEIDAKWQMMQPRPGVVAALKGLRQHYVTSPLSNADTPLVEAISSHFGLSWKLQWRKIIGTEDARAFKPDPAVYRLGLDRLGLEAHQVLHVASHPYDLDAAKAVGFRTAYLHWPGYASPVEPGRFDYLGDDLTDLATQLGAILP